MKVYQTSKALNNNRYPELKMIKSIGISNSDPIKSCLTIKPCPNQI